MNEIEQKDECRYCRGTGMTNARGTKLRCSVCRGTGTKDAKRKI